MERTRAGQGKEKGGISLHFKQRGGTQQITKVNKGKSSKGSIVVKRLDINIKLESY